MSKEIYQILIMEEVTTGAEQNFNYRGFSPKPTGGGVFFYTSLKMNQENSSLLKIGFP